MSNAPAVTEVTIQGHVFKIDAPYTVGYQLKQNEASAMNGLLAENVRNNTAALVKDAKVKSAGLDAKTATKEQLDAVTLSDDEVAAVQAQIDQYVQAYEFGVRAGGGRSKDPIQREIENMATEILDNALRAKGFPVSKFKKEQANKYSAALQQVIDTRRDELTKEAKRRVNAVTKGGELSLDSLLGSPDAEDRADDATQVDPA